MGVYVVTGSASGMGAAVAARLRVDGHTVIGVDLADAEVTADLSGAAGRSAAIEDLLGRIDGPLDGAVMAAGLGPKRGRERTLVEVNVLGVTELLNALSPRLAQADAAKVVIFGSNSTTTTPLVPRGAIRHLVDGNTAKATAILKRRGQLSGPASYAASKIAISRWARRTAVSPDWAGAGIRLNVIAPGPVLTPLLRGQLATGSGAQIKSFPVPIGKYGTPEQLAEWVMLMLSPAADFMVGSVVTVDGGTEALMRPTAWPTRLPVTSLPHFIKMLRGARANKQLADYSEID